MYRPKSDDTLLLPPRPAGSQGRSLSLFFLFFFRKRGGAFPIATTKPTDIYGPLLKPIMFLNSSVFHGAFSLEIGMYDDRDSVE